MNSVRLPNDAFPTILTLSGTIPGEPGVGGVILEDLRRGLPAQSLQFIPAVTNHVINAGWLEQACGLSGHVIRRYETAWRPLRGMAGEVVGWGSRKTLFNRHCRRLVTQICQHKAAKSCDKIWAVLDCPTVIQIAIAVANRLDKPLVVLVWDAPELLVDQLGMDRWSAANLLVQFKKTIQQAERVGVVCEQMRLNYEQKLGPKSYVIIRHGIDQQLWHRPETPSDPDRMIIGFAGSITAQSSFRQLINTLDANHWRVNDKDVTLRLIGCRHLLDSRRPQRIEYFGWRGLEATVQLLSECSMLYLPQPFEPHLKPLAELSFPTKLSTYLAAGRRVLLHAPSYASVTPLLADYSVGLQCESLEINAIQTTLERLDTLPSSKWVAAIHAARRDEFNHTVFLNRFCDLVGATLPSSQQSESLAHVAESV